ERIQRLADKREAVAALNGVLGRPADATLAHPAQQPVLAVRSGHLSDALNVLDSSAHPAVLAQQARARAARTNVELQRRNRYPDVTFGVGAMQREDGLESMEVMLEVEIPF